MPDAFGTRAAQEATSPQTPCLANPLQRYRPSRRRTGKRYNPLFERYVIALRQSGLSPLEVAARTGVPASTIRGWTVSVGDVSGGNRVTPERPDLLEMQLLRQDLDQIRHERDVFREAAGLLSKERPETLDLELLRLELTHIGGQRDAYMDAVAALSAPPTVLQIL